MAAILLSCMRTPRSRVHSKTATRIMLSPEFVAGALMTAPRGVEMAACICDETSCSADAKIIVELQNHDKV